MPTKITFENATLADAVMKASRVAPTKGAGFDKAQGFLLDVNVADQNVVLCATDLETTFRMTVPAVKASGDSTIWRVPSGVISGIIGGLSMAAEASIELIDRGDGSLRLKSGHTAVRLNMIAASDYPNVVVYSQDGMTPAQALSGKIEQVSWSVDKTGSGPASGIRVTGEHLVGVNPFGIALVPCSVPLPEPVTVPLALLTPLLKGASDVRAKADGDRFVIGLDAETVVTTQLIQGEFLDYSRVLRDNFTITVSVRKQSFIDCLNQILVLLKTDRQPTLCMTLDTEGILPMLRMDADVEEVGRMQTGLDVNTDHSGPPLRMYFKPSMLVDAVDHAKGEMVTFCMGNSTDPSRDALSSLCVKDGGGYLCYVMPMRGA